ncbi:ribosome small subunit-dependent GTPase A [Bacteriovorax stolpii]|uniref:Small ribosomal subunit biogenesis GTPase RsgA n=1 Tax=Bacteriovorax stolpii TaxID=960 RepID=A0A2K9NNS5_BACTC|nr:ribosome small subunit-dependent GTPase A [Bacteriovorax stolpii]AUN97142.1 ribosome small subunit-dependent GTPase A [Bacteriovorax stolpii]TDP53428.1 ribosome biogenesis GTPase [Bacteriovorax stolpii]
MLKKARVFKSAKREFDCKIIDTNEMVVATALGNLLKGDDNSIVVGDYVMIDEKNVITEVLPRNNEIYRLIIREQKKKVTASNCDLMVIVSSVSRPEYKRGIVDRFLVRAHQWGIRPLIVFNKMDEFDPNVLDMKFEFDRMNNLGIECFEVSAAHTDYKPQVLSLGLNDLKERLQGKTSIFLGQSGVGKSKLITASSEGKIKLLSREVGKVGKGTHTTTWSEIVDCESMSLIDSPGIRSFGVEDLLEEDLITYFPDIEEGAVQCKFSNCTHEPGTAGCFFYTKLDQNAYETTLIMSRLESFLRMKEEISQTPSYLKR